MSDFVKKTDAWIEVLVFDMISTPLAKTIIKYCQHKSTPYIITIISFLFRLLSCFLILNKPFLASFSWFIAMILDSLDGKVSRAISGKDPELRGSLDSFLDSIAVTLIFILVSILLINQGSAIQAILFVTYLSTYLLFETFVASKYRIQGILGVPTNVSYLNANPEGLGFVRKVVNAFGKYRLVFHPTILEAQVLLFIIGPLLFFPVWLLFLAIFCLWCDLVINAAIPTVLMVLKKT